jgi:hypothetical protein
MAPRHPFRLAGSDEAHRAAEAATFEFESPRTTKLYDRTKERLTQDGGREDQIMSGTTDTQRQARPRAPVRGSTLGRIVLVYLPDSNSFRQVDPLRVERDRGFADSLLEQAGFEL